MTSVDLVFLRFEKSQKNLKKSQKTIDKRIFLWYNGFTQGRKESKMGSYGIFRKSTGERVAVICASHKILDKSGNINFYFGRLLIGIVETENYYVTELLSKGGTKGDCKRNRTKDGAK